MTGDVIILSVKAYTNNYFCIFRVASFSEMPSKYGTSRGIEELFQEGSARTTIDQLIVLALINEGFFINEEFKHTFSVRNKSKNYVSHKFSRQCQFEFLL
jgi:hypothetical protein